MTASVYQEKGHFARRRETGFKRGGIALTQRKKHRVFQNRAAKKAFTGMVENALRMRLPRFCRRHGRIRAKKRLLKSPIRLRIFRKCGKNSIF